MYKKYIYSVALVALFFVFVVEGDRIFVAPKLPQASKSMVTEKKYVSPYVTISAFDDHFREAADSIGWDWKLLAAIGFTESRFDSTALSQVGASGVMQVMPRTLQQFGVPDSLRFEPRRNIMAATGLLKSLDHIFRRIDNVDERSNFVLASYNAGIGHISDAMRLADKYGRNRYKWENSVDTFLILKKEPQYYTDSLCKNGQFNDWKQTIQFIKKVKRRWHKYKKLQEAYDDSIRNIMQNDSTVKFRCK